MSNPTRITPKASLTFKNVDSSLNLADKSSSAVVAVKKKIEDTTLTLNFTDATARAPSTLKGVSASVEQRFGPKIAVTGTYAFDNKAWKLQGNWEGNIAEKKTTLKSVYSFSDKKVSTEATIIPKKHHKATVTLSKLQADSAKYSFLHGDITYEPAYSFPKQAFSISATKKRGNQSYKIAYDFKSENGTFEWSTKPYKITVNAPVSHNKLGKATVGLVWEKEFHV